MIPSRLTTCCAICLALAPLSLRAQVIDLTKNDVGIAIGDKPRVTGLRINFRDRNLREVRGVNVTIWSPYEPATGNVYGLALGLPATGAKNIRGIGVGILGLGTSQSMKGIAVGGLGVGGGGDIEGLTLGGIGVGSGGHLRGIQIGGIGVGSGGSVTGLSVGGIGVGGGGAVRGIQIGGIGVGGGAGLTGLSIGGIGVGSGADVRGISIGGIGVGSGGDITGLSVGGIGVGGGGRVRGLSIGGVGVGAPRLEGVVLSGIASGGQFVHAIVFSTAYFKVDSSGRFDGGSLSAVNNVSGSQHGLTIGLWNYARELHGAQLGLINISDNGGRRRIFPLISVR